MIELFVDGFHLSCLPIDSAFATLEQFTDKDHWTDDVHFIRMIRVQEGTLVFEICISPVSIADKMRQSIFASSRRSARVQRLISTMIYTYWSSVSVFLQLTGGCCELTVRSPDYEHYLLLLTPNDAHRFKESESEAFTMSRQRKPFQAQAAGRLSCSQAIR